MALTFIDNRKVSDETFHQLDLKDHFLFNNTLYVKIAEHDEHDDDFNAFNLSTSELCMFEKLDSVESVKKINVAVVE